MSIFFIFIIASNARLADARSGSVIASMLESGTAVEAEACHADDAKFYGQHLSLFTLRVMAGGPVDCGDCTVGKRLGVRAGGFFCGAVIPKRNYGLGQCCSGYGGGLSG